jgi:mycothiol synthase
VAEPLALRPATRGDAEAIAELLNLISRRLGGTLETATEIEGWFGLPRLETVVAHDRGGMLVGYADMQAASDDYEKFALDFRVHPERPEAFAPLLAELERRAVAVAAPGASLRAYVPGAEERLATALRRSGYETIRHSFVMEIELDAPPDAPFPDGYALRSFRPGDEQAVHAAHMESFADHWGFEPTPYDEWATANLERDDFDPSLWLLAEREGETAGIVLCRLLDDTRGPIGWVNVLGVTPRHRRAGLGGALLRASFRELLGRGRTRIGLGVDGENTTNAVKLYEDAGMRAVRRTDEFERRL